MRYAWFTLVLALSALAVWGGFGVSQHLIVAIDKWGDAAPNLQPTLNRMNPVIAKADTAFGNLSKATGDWSDASKQQARDVRTLLAAGGRAIDGITEDADALRQTAGAATESAHALTATIEEGHRTLQAAQPVLANSDGAVDDLRRLLRDQAVTATLTNMQNIAAQGAGILGDVRMMADKEREDFLKPVPWYLWPIKRSAQFIDIGAAVARHTP